MRLKLFSITLLIAVFTVNAQVLYAKAALKVFTEPGVDVYVDNKFMGTSELMKGGLHLDEVSTGEHLITLYKSESWPQKRVVTFKENEEYSYYTQPFSGSVSSGCTYNIAQQGSGQFAIKSYPVNIKVDIEELDVQLVKTHEKLVLNGLKEGSYKLVFNWNEKQLIRVVFIRPDQKVLIQVNMETEVIQCKGLTHHGEDDEANTVVFYGD